MTEEVNTNNIDDDTSLEEMELSFDDFNDEDEVGTSEESTETEDNAESEEEVETTDAEDEVEEVESEEESEETEASETEDKAEDTHKSDEEARKQHNREMAEKRIQEKKQKELDMKQQQSEYIAKAEDDRDLALRQLQVEAYNTKIETNTNKLQNSYEKALNDFTILRSKSPEIQAEIDMAVDNFQRMYVSLDKYGNPTEVREDLYSYLKTKAESIQRLTKIGAKQEANAKTKSKANVIAVPSAKPKEAKRDEGFDAFDEEANRW